MRDRDATAAEQDTSRKPIAAALAAAGRKATGRGARKDLLMLEPRPAPEDGVAAGSRTGAAHEEGA